MVRAMLVYDSRAGLVQELAEGARSGASELTALRVDEASSDELLYCDGLILGLPNWTSVTGELKTCMDESGDLWEGGEPVGRPGVAFTAGWSPHGGLKVTLLTLMHLLVGHGMLFVSLPWSDAMHRLGSYDGATAAGEVTDDDRVQARLIDRLAATLAVRLAPA